MFIYREGQGTVVMQFYVCPIHCKNALESGHEARIVLIDFNVASGRVNQQGILDKLDFVGIGNSVLSILTQFLSNQSQHVMVDGCRSKLVNIVPGVPQGIVLGLLLFRLYTSELFSILENTLIGYADGSTLMVVVPSPVVRVIVAESLIRDHCSVCEWCDLRKMKLMRV